MTLLAIETYWSKIKTQLESVENESDLMRWMCVKEWSQQRKSEFGMATNGAS